MAMLELEVAMLEVVVGANEEVGLDGTGLELDTAMLELEVGPDEETGLEDAVLELGPDGATEFEAGVLELDPSPGAPEPDDTVLGLKAGPEETGEFGGTLLELVTTGLDVTDEVVPPIPLELAIVELIEELYVTNGLSAMLG